MRVEEASGSGGEVDVWRCAHFPGGACLFTDTRVGSIIPYGLRDERRGKDTSSEVDWEGGEGGPGSP